MKKIFKIVLTGSTSVGKTTVIEILKKRGYSTMPEFSRVLIEEEQARNGDIFPWTQPSVFQDMYAKRQYKEESNLDSFLTDLDKAKLYTTSDSTEPVTLFMDRCMIDNLAFCSFNSIPTPKEVDDFVQRLHSQDETYSLIFILDHLPTYTLDSGRKINQEESRVIQGYIRDAYKSYGYEMISVPYMEPERRADFILKKSLEHINLSNKKR